MLTEEQIAATIAIFAGAANGDYSWLTAGQMLLQGNVVYFFVPAIVVAGTLCVTVLVATQTFPFISSWVRKVRAAGSGAR